MRRWASSSALVWAGAPAACARAVQGAAGDIDAEMAARQASRLSRSALHACFDGGAGRLELRRGLLGAGVASSISTSSEARRLRSAKRLAAALGASAAAIKPSQRQTSPSRETSRWPGFNCGCSAWPSAARDNTDMGKAARKCGGASTSWTAAWHHPAGAAVSDSGGRPRQWTGAPSSDEASMSSPKGCGKRRFIAGFDLDLVDQRRPQVAAASLQEVRQCTDFRLQAVGLAAGLVMGCALFGLGRAGRAQRGFRFGHAALRIRPPVRTALRRRRPASAPSPSTSVSGPSGPCAGRSSAIRCRGG